MAYPLVPPPAGDVGALTWPRQLQRWLDDNPVGPLTRVSTYITLPAFTQASNTWNGYSDIVEAFNFEGPNHFSLKAFAVPIAPNYSLCISYQVQGIVTRYSLWRATGDNIPGPVIPYINQYIDKNFRLEVWNTSQGVASQSSVFTFYTGKLGGVDYRWGTDSQLIGSDAPVTNFENINSPVQLPTSQLSLRWRPQDMNWDGIAGHTLTNWKDEIHGVVITPTGLTYVNLNFNPPVPATPTYAFVVSGTISGTSVGANVGDVAVLFYVATLPGSTSNIYNNGAQVSIAVNSAGNIVVNGFNGNITIALNTWYLVLFINVSPFGNVYLFTPNDGNQADFWPCNNTNQVDGTITIGGPDVGISDVTTYAQLTINTPSSIQTLLAFYTTNYFTGMSLPLTFPANATSVTN